MGLIDIGAPLRAVSGVVCSGTNFVNAMVLAEVILWASHGNAASTSSPTDAAATRLGFATTTTTTTTTTVIAGSDDGNNNNSSPNSTNQHRSRPATIANDESVENAKRALSLLSSTRGSGGGRRPPIYATDVHPDGTRFATAGGDGTVRIWSTACLFGGKNNAAMTTTPATAKAGSGVATSKFDRGGNYVSSNTEDYDDDDNDTDNNANNDTSLEVNGKGGTGRQLQQPQQDTQTHAATTVGINDLSGLVRRKKGGGTTTANQSSSSSSATAVANSGPMSPLSRLTRPTTTTAAAHATIPPTTGINMDTKKPTTKRNNKLLCTITSHDGSVLAIRFSPSGTYLATAGDDAVVKIYTRSSLPSLMKGNLVGASSNNNTKSEDDVENWNRIALCRGHRLDVVGLTWAPDDSHLVSCSLDSMHPIIVWRLFGVLDGNDDNNNNDNNTTATTQSAAFQYLHPYKILGRNVHTSTVKGVAFDPAGKYLASSGDDPAICIWRTSDDWELEARIDSENSGVFRSKKRKRDGVNNNTDESLMIDNDMEDDPGELASLSLFRRISFAPDGSHVCATNATLRGKNIAAMISRDGGWAADSCCNNNSNGTSRQRQAPPPGAANLVGHKQPIVASRHCPIFFTAPPRGRGKNVTSYDEDDDTNENDDDDDENEPNYATLVALGDKRGFVTIWSTKSSRPLFKMQCSESRCTVTDISWGYNPICKSSLVLIISLLDGYVVGLNFDIPTEVGGGSMLSSVKTQRIFQSKYGIEDYFVGFSSAGRIKQRTRRLVNDSTGGPMLVENALQMATEMETDEAKRERVSGTGGTTVDTLITAAAGHSRGGSNTSGKGITPTKSLLKVVDSVSLSPVANSTTTSPTVNRVSTNVSDKASGRQTVTTTQQSNAAPVVDRFGPVMKIPCTTNKILSVELPSTAFLPAGDNGMKIIADCTNSTSGETLSSSSSSSCPSFTLSISRGGVRKWKDIIVKTRATAIAANGHLLAVGTSDGRLYLYGTSSTLGWSSCRAYRAFPPFVLGSPIVQLHVRSSTSTMVVVTSDGDFSVYSIVCDKPKLSYRGSILPAMQHIYLQQRSSTNTAQHHQPKLARIQITDANHLMLILVLPLKSSGRLLSGFVYNLPMKLWMCISDTNDYVLSDLYSSLPSGTVTPGGDVNGVGILSQMDRLVRSSASAVMSAKQMYQKVISSEGTTGPTTNDVVTRSHCEDRLACSIALGSSTEFKQWLRYYSRHLVTKGDEDALRFLVDIMLTDIGLESTSSQSGSAPSFLAFGKETLGLNGKDLVRGIILPECLASRSLQRFTNEISMELLLE